MTVKELQEKINSNEIIAYNGHNYIAVGYQLMKRKGQKIKSAILQDTKQTNSIIYVELEKVEE